MNQPDIFDIQRLVTTMFDRSKKEKWLRAQLELELVTAITSHVDQYASTLRERIADAEKHAKHLKQELEITKRQGSLF